MRTVSTDIITKTVRELCIDANKVLPCSLENMIRSSTELETEPMAKAIMGDLCANLDAAREMDIPICQDTGMAVVFAEVGREVYIDGNFEVHKKQCIVR